MNTLDFLDKKSLRDDVPEFGPGDTLDVHVKVIELFPLGLYRNKRVGPGVYEVPVLTPTGLQYLVPYALTGSRFTTETWRHREAQSPPYSSRAPVEALREFGAGRSCHPGLNGFDTMIALCQIRPTPPLENGRSMG